MVKGAHISNFNGDMATIDELYSSASGNTKYDNIVAGILKKHPDAQYFTPMPGIFEHIGASSGLADGQQVKGLFVTKGDTTRLWFMKENAGSNIYSAPVTDFNKVSSASTSNADGVVDNTGDGGSNWNNVLQTALADATNTNTTTVANPPTTTSPTTTTNAPTGDFWSTIGTDLANALPGIINASTNTTLQNKSNPNGVAVPITNKSSNTGMYVGLVLGILLGGGIGAIAMRQHRVVGIIVGAVGGGITGLIVGKVA